MKREEFTLIELLVVIAIIAILASLLLPALSRAKETARISECAGRLKQAGISFESYSQDWKGFIPDAYISDMNRWTYRLSPYFGYKGETFIGSSSQASAIDSYYAAKRYLICQTAKDLHASSYVSYNYGHNNEYDHSKAVYSVKTPSALALCSEAAWNIASSWYVNHINVSSCLDNPTTLDWGTHQDKRRVNFLYLDGHVASADRLKVPRTGTTEGNLFWRGY